MAKCTAKSTRTGNPCQAPAIRGATVCRSHGGATKHVARKAIVRAELADWGLDDQVDDPGETLLRLVSQSRRRAEFYALLLQRAYDAADALREAVEAEKLVADTEGAEYETPAIQQAKHDLRSIFVNGGVAALIGHQWDATKDGLMYATGENIRALADLEMRERKLCADFAAKAIAAGIAERRVRVEEQQAAMVVRAVDAMLDQLGLDDAQRAQVPAIAERVFRDLATTTPEGLTA